MPLDAKALIWDGARFGGLGIQKHPDRSSYHPGAWPQDVKIFEFDVFGPQDLEFEASNILRSCPWMLRPQRTAKGPQR